jgi:dTMP kinase
LWFVKKGGIYMISRYFALEGLDGSGKTTQYNRLVEALKNMGIGHVVSDVREPGGTDIGEKVRKYLLGSDDKSLWAEVLGFAFARAVLVQSVIKPLLAEEGNVIVVDRCFASSIAYQGCARGAEVDLVKQIADLTMRGCYPDQIFILDISVQESIRRLKNANRSGEVNHFDIQSLMFKSKVREGYLWFAKQYSLLCTVIDGELSPDVIAEQIFNKSCRIINCR